MSKKKSKMGLIIIVIAFMLIMVFAIVWYNSLKEKHVDTAGSLDESFLDENITPIPNFTIYNADMGIVNIEDYKGKVVVLNFWASWCGWCDKEMPGFNNIYNKYKDDENVEILMINVTTGENEDFGVGETFLDAKKYLDGKDFDFNIYYDTELIGSTIFNATTSLPITAFLDTDGNLVAYQPGYIEEDILEKTIVSLLNKNF